MQRLYLACIEDRLLGVQKVGHAHKVLDISLEIAFQGEFSRVNLSEVLNEGALCDSIISKPSLPSYIGIQNVHDLGAIPLFFDL